jgi:hypothetical protein
MQNPGLSGNWAGRESGGVAMAAVLATSGIREKSRASALPLSAHA